MTGARVMSANHRNKDNSGELLEWRDPHGVFPIFIIIPTLILVGTGFAFSVNAGLICSAVFVLMLVLMWIIDGSDPRVVRLSSSGMTVRNKRGGERFYPAAKLGSAVISSLLVKPRYGESVKLEEGSVRDKQHQPIIKFKEHFRVPPEEVAKRIAEYYDIPLRDERKKKPYRLI